MLRVILVSILFLTSAFNSFTLNNNYSVSGRILVKNKGTIFIQIFDEKYSKSNKRTGYVKGMELQISEKELKEGNVSFIFNGLSADKYAIQCFQDINGNRKLDTIMGIPSEPWGTYKKTATFPKFKNISFNVTKNIDNIEIYL